MKRKQVVQEGIDAMVSSIMEIIEPCVRKRITQYMETAEEYFQQKRNKSKGGQS